ncbi:MAG: preprotein translocase subunit SecG [Patescibacteria group bacterium]
MIISILQIIISVVLIALILLQERGSGLSGVFGGSGEGFYQTRRGLEKIIFIATIILIVSLAGLSLADIFLK